MHFQHRTKRLDAGTILTAETINAVRSDEPEGVDPESGDSGKQEKIVAQTSADKERLPERDDLTKEQRLDGERENNFQSSETTDIEFHSEDSARKLERAIERTDRKTLQEWYDYTFALRDLLSNVEKDARKCGCTDMYEPILNSQKKISHGLNAISKKLRSDEVVVANM